VIRTALGLELRTLARSPLRILFVVVTLATGLFVVVQGQKDVDRWHTAISAAREKQGDSVEEARTFFAEGKVGPEDRPWVDLTKAHWQDWYAGTRLVREPADLAGIAFASPEAGAVAVRVFRYSDPMVAQGTKIENPELVAAGGLDLVTVIALLLPLLVLALGVEVGGFERSNGILPLVRVQSGRDRSWLAARCGAVGIIGAVVGLVLVAAAAIVGGAGLTPVLALGGLVVVYVALWTVVLACVALVARHASQGAVALGTAWIALCVLVPAIGVERAASLSAEDFGLDLTVEARDAGQALANKSDKEVIGELVQRFPKLASLVPENEEEAAGTARQGLRIVALEDRLTKREEVGQAQADLVGWTSILSPAVALTRALERLAGRDPQAASAYRHAVAAATAQRMERYIAASWSDEALDADDFEQLLAATPESVESSSGLPQRELAILIAWIVGLFGVAVFVSRPAARRSVANVNPTLATAQN